MTVDDKAVGRPSVLVVGGFATVPPNYWPMRRRLLARGAARVDIAPIWLHDWALAGVLGLGRVRRRTERAISDTFERAGRQPIIVIGHSGGGVAARLAMSTIQYRGQPHVGRAAVAIRLVVSSPWERRMICTGSAPGIATRVTKRSSSLIASPPGASYSQRTRYLTVAGILTPQPSYRALRWATEQAFSVIIGEQLWDPGDGIVPASAAHLQRAENMTLREVSHGTLASRWYGSAEVVDEWWRPALRLWKEAVVARLDTRP